MILIRLQSLILFLSLSCVATSALGQTAASPKSTTAASGQTGTTTQQPPVSADPQVTTASYGDWLLRCVKLPAVGEEKHCEITQSIQVEGQTQPIAQIAVGHPTAKDPIHITVVLPNNVSFPTGVKLGLTDKDSQPIELPWKRCVPGGCFADTTLTESVIARWRETTASGQIQFVDASARTVSLPFSFRGMSQALEALAKTS